MMSEGLESHVVGPGRTPGGCPLRRPLVPALFHSVNSTVDGGVDLRSEPRSDDAPHARQDRLAKEARRRRRRVRERPSSQPCQGHEGIRPPWWRPIAPLGMDGTVCAAGDPLTTKAEAGLARIAVRPAALEPPDRQDGGPTLGRGVNMWGARYVLARPVPARLRRPFRLGPSSSGRGRRVISTISRTRRLSICRTP